MAMDLGHLEKMGRELKCPICLSLLSSAVSLVCNHMFCSPCISKSMKSTSDCPVCKVPYHRREVRPAPHMDNMVNIYKSMELAAGVNIFVTQTAPLVRNSDEMNCKKNMNDSGNAISEKKCNGKSKRKRVLMKANQDKENTGPCNMAKVPSFQANKRVHVTPYPPAETPQRPEKIMHLAASIRDCKKNIDLGELETSLQDKNVNRSLSSKEVISLDKDGDAMFSPFFWLREGGNETEGESTQPTADDGMPTPSAPSFSDVKDSDEETPLKMTPTSKSSTAQFFDSELFEWTQRACSPELLSTPIKKQKPDKSRSNGPRTKYNSVSDAEPAEHNQVLLGEGVKHKASNVKSKFCITNGRVKKIIKKKGSKGKIQRKNVTYSRERNATGVNESFQEEGKICVDMAENSSLENMVIDNENLPGSTMNINMIGDVSRCLRKRPVKRLKNQLDNKGMVDAQFQVSSQCINAKIQKQESNDAKGQFLAISCQKSGTSKTVSESKKRSKKARSEPCQKLMTSMDDAIARILEEVPPPCEELPKLYPEGNQHLKMQLCESAKGNYNKDEKTDAEFLEAKGTNTQVTETVGGQNGEASHAEYRSNLRVRKGSTSLHQKLTRNPKQKKSTKQTDNFGGAVALGEIVNSMIDSEPNSAGNGNPGNAAHENSVEVQEAVIGRVHWLKKCSGASAQIKCAFCQTSDETEVSGEILHFFNGKLVAADHNGGVNIIHSHKNCTEWAPNVYFEDEVVVNLSNEIARSKRIKCSCCAIKGAALGCFEKSCQKSFHFTCAKLMPQCRWDTENFVMLCPIHIASKLPCEGSQPKKQRKRKTTAKREQQAHEIVKPSNDEEMPWKWPFGSPFKWVLCCSALSAPEKEIVSEFTKLSGISLSKAWNPNVTHIIASVDESGACRRTLKILLGITEGKWILKIDWVKTCLAAREPVGEEQFEIKVDNHGSRDGPQLGRLRVLQKKPKLFCGFKFYFMGDFTATYKGYLHELVTASGGSIMHRKPVSKGNLLDETEQIQVYIIYSCELPEKQSSTGLGELVAHRRYEAKKLGDASGAKVASNTWILDSIAACTLLSLD